MLNRKIFGHILRVLLLFSLALACSSLSTQKKFYEPITADLQDGNYEAAIKGLEKAREKNKFTDKDRFIYYMDAGLANYYAARFDSSNVKLTEAE